MSKLIWDEIGKKLGETGVSNAILFPMPAGVYSTGVPWNGFTSLNEAPTGAAATPFYADNLKYMEIMSSEEFAGSIGCFMYPDEFKPCIGEKELHAGVTVGQQGHQPFGLCYRTEVVSDTEGIDAGFKLHLVYNTRAGVSTRDHKTVNETPELEELSFDFTSTKVPVTGEKPTAHLVIDSTKIAEADAPKFQTLLDTLYGTDTVGEVTGKTPKLPLPDEVKAIFAGT